MDGGSALYDEVVDSIDYQKVAEKLLDEGFGGDEALKSNISTLKKLYNKIEQNNAILRSKVSTRARLTNLLGGEKESLIINDDNKETLLPFLLDGYHLTTEILHQLGLIKEVNFVFTYIDDKGNYRRAGNIVLTSEMVRFERASSEKGGYYSMRLNEAAVLSAFKTETEEEKKIAEKINNDFKVFSKPFYDYQENNNTGWKMNKGVVAEAFERHLENRHRGMLSIDSWPCEMESEGRRWLMYRRSSGSSPYYTGPDTKYSQVKNVNASLIDNVDTVLNVMAAIIRSSEIADENTKKNLPAALEKAFRDSKQKPTIAKNIWTGLEETVKNEMKEIENATEVRERKNDFKFYIKVKV